MRFSTVVPALFAATAFAAIGEPHPPYAIVGRQAGSNTTAAGMMTGTGTGIMSMTSTGTTGSTPTSTGSGSGGAGGANTMGSDMTSSTSSAMPTQTTGAANKVEAAGLAFGGLLAALLV